MNKKEENFKRIAERRTNEIIDKIESLENLKNVSFYSYSEEQIKAIFKAIEEQTKRTKAILLKEQRKRFKI